jgi:hypothetical protein
MLQSNMGVLEKENPSLLVPWPIPTINNEVRKKFVRMQMTKY